MAAATSRLVGCAIAEVVAGSGWPEGVVTLVAVTSGGTAEAKDIGVGAAMGGPLALGTVAYGVTGAMLVLQRRKRRAMVLAGAGAGAGAGAAEGPEDAASFGKEET